MGSYFVKIKTKTDRTLGNSWKLLENLGKFDHPWKVQHFSSLWGTAIVAGPVRVGPCHDHLAPSSAAAEAELLLR